MPTQDLKNTIHVVNLKSANVSSDTWTNYVDLAGWDSATITVTAEMDTADSNNYILPVAKCATSTPGSTTSYTSVSAADLRGSFSALNATGSRSAQYVGYTGSARYLAVLLEKTGTAAGEIHVSVILSHSGDAPRTSATTGSVS